MQFFTVAILCCVAQLASAATTSLRACNRDDCLRAVVASSFPTRSGAADCSSFFKDTVTPATVYKVTFLQTNSDVLIHASSTVTKSSGVATVTSTLTVASLAQKEKRDAAASEPAKLDLAPRQVTATPTSIPAYASACSGTARYSSACSCIGATHTTITSAKAPTTTTTLTFSATTTLTECANPFPTFILQLENSGIVVDGKALDGTYAQFDDGDGPLIGFNGSPRSEAIVLSLNAPGNLVMAQNGLIAVSDYGQSMELLHFNDVADAYATEDPATCSVAGARLTCSTGAPKILMLCPGEAVTNDLFIGMSFQAPPCVAPTLKVVSVCVVP